MTKNYQSLEHKILRIAKLGTAAASLHWDLTQNTPDGAKNSLSEAIGNISALSHEMFISKEIGDLIEEAASEKLDEWQEANLKLIKKNYINATLLPSEFVEKYSIACSKSQSVWQKSKATSDWDAFKPHLEEVLQFTKEVARLKSEKFGVSPYDALLDQYDPERKTEEFESVFSVLKKELPTLVSEIIEKQKNEQTISIKEHISSTIQKEISKKIMEHMGFDFGNGRIDEYEHPYCIHTAGGVRILSKFLPEDFLQGVMATVHETGHALYEQNLPEKYKHQPVGSACGMSVHESQSLIMELQVGGSREFSNFFAKLLHDEFGFKGSEFESENIYKSLNKVKQSLIRVTADEATYPLHVILRFEIEKALLDGSIKVSDIPAIWNEKMQEYLHIKPTSHKEGAMQDVHWSSGGFGYFPCYVGGSINASMLAKTARDKGFLTKEDISKGDFKKIKEFLKENIWHNASRFTPSKLIENTTGEPTLNPETFLKYLREKFLG